jgi:hypothetical protein
MASVDELDDFQMRLDSWKEFQSRQGPYASRDTEGTSNGLFKVSLNGVKTEAGFIYSQAQANAVNFLNDGQNTILDNLLNNLLLEFPALKEIYEDDLPDVSNIEQYKELIGLSTVHIMTSQMDGFAYIGFELGCKWDEEHGAGIMIHKDRVISIGQADEAFNSWTTYKDNGTLEIEEERWKEQHAHRKKNWWNFW